MCHGGREDVGKSRLVGVSELLTRRRLLIAATRDYAKKLMTSTLMSVPKVSSCFGRKCVACTPRTGRGVLNMLPRAVSSCNIIDRRATRRVTRNTTGRTRTKYTITAAKITKPKKKALGAPIKAIYFKYFIRKGVFSKARRFANAEDRVERTTTTCTVTFLRQYVVGACKKALYRS